MKKNLLLIIILFSSIYLFGQISKGNVMVSLDGNYMKTISGSGVPTNENTTKGKYLNAGTSVAYFITHRTAVGIGLDYQWTKETTFNLISLKLPEVFHTRYEIMDSKSLVLRPHLFLEYYIPISQKLYVSTNLKFSDGTIKTELISHTIPDNRRPDDGELMEPFPALYVGTSKKSTLHSFTAQLSPELTYFITPKLMGCLALGGIECSILDTRTTTYLWAVNFNTAYWQLGVKIKI